MNALTTAAEVTYLPLDAANTPIYGKAARQLRMPHEAANDSCGSAPQSSGHYATDHRLAKLVVFLTYILLGATSIETGNPYIALVAGTCIWFFGINAVGYVIESFMGHRHTHCWL
jgi:hypothetical protein